METIYNVFGNLQDTLTNLQKSMDEMQKAFSILGSTFTPNEEKKPKEQDLLVEVKDTIFNCQEQKDAAFNNLLDAFKTFWKQNGIIQLYPENLPSLDTSIIGVYYNKGNDSFECEFYNNNCVPLDAAFNYASLKSVYNDLIEYVANLAKEDICAADADVSAAQATLVECLYHMLANYCDGKLHTTELDLHASELESIPNTIKCIFIDTENHNVKACRANNTTDIIQIVFNNWELQKLCESVAEYCENHKS